MYDFYNLFYNMRYLKIDDVREACRWGCITKEEYKEITSEDYLE